MTLTNNKKLNEPALNDPNWNIPLNANFDIIDNALGSFVTIATTAGDYPLVIADLQCMCWKSNTSAFTANVTYTIPTGIKGQWVVINQSASSTYTLSIVCGSSSILVDRGKSRSIYCDGTSVFYADSPASAGSNTQIIYNSAGTLTGSSNLTFNGTSVFGVGSSTATINASCAGTTATVTFNNGQTIPVGSIVTITGVTPTGYNGTWVTTGTATLNQVQFTVPASLTSQTVAGTLSYGNLNLGGNLIGGIASQALAAAGTNNNSVMTPLATAQAITALTPGKTITRATAVTTTSGTNVDFTGIPSWVKRITIMFSGVSTSGTSIPQVQLGISTGIEITGYVGSSSTVDASIGYSTYSSGFSVSNSWSSSSVLYGYYSIMNITGNVWVESHSGSSNSGGATVLGGGTKTLAGVLDRVRITTANGTDTFDAGTINILYEG